MSLFKPPAHQPTQLSRYSPPLNMAAPAAQPTTPTPTYSVIQHYTAEQLTARLRHADNNHWRPPPRTTGRVMEYRVTHRPPADWLYRRHRDMPAMFRDSFGHTHWWTAEQQAAIRAYFTNWSTDEHHPIRQLGGYMSWQSSAERNKEVDAGFPNHLIEYWLKQRDLRSPTDMVKHAAILYGAFLPATAPVTQLVRRGPAGLGFHDYDLFLPAGMRTLNIIVGMQHCNTGVHVDQGAEAVWHLLLEGQKLWMVGRREDEAAMKAVFPPDKKLAWYRLERAQQDWMQDNGCMTIIQNAGDIIYLPAEWPHAVKHLTDTLALQSTMLQSWDSERALDLYDFTTNEMRNNPKYQTTMEWAVAHPEDSRIEGGQLARMSALLPWKLEQAKKEEKKEEKKDGEEQGKRKKRKE